MVNCWERDNLLALLYVMFSCVFVTFPCGALGQMRYLIVLILIFAFLLTLSERGDYKLSDKEKDIHVDH